MCPHGTLRIMFLYKGQSVLTLARAISFKEKQSVYKATFVGCGGGGKIVSIIFICLCFQVLCIPLIFITKKW